MTLSKSLILVLAIFIGLAIQQASDAQVPSTTVQLPTIVAFNVQTTVIIPDGGTMMLGSVGRSSMGSTERGVPLLSNIPGAGRLFRNRGIGQETSARTATATAQIISMKELEPAILAEGNQRLSETNRTADAETQRRAEFLSQNVGQSTKRR
jgi:type II secretory pathway component GspD/PulD (secretin)